MTSDDLSAYEEEALVNELGTGRPIWLPIQKSVAKALRQEIQPGAKMKLLLRYFGLREHDAIYLLIDFSALKGESAANNTRKEPQKRSWASVCQLIHCDAKGGQFINPAIDFYLLGKFTGRTRPISPKFVAHMKNYDKHFPGSFQVPLEKILSFMGEEAELKETGSGTLLWVPVAKGDIAEWVKPKLSPDEARLYIATYGSANGELYLLSMQVKPASNPSNLLRRRN